MVASPKVFISHASEDKPFVLTLAKRLRGDGVDAWVDKWEILIGDSLIDKIFSEGIGQCSVFLVVLSGSSVSKPWVREEINAGFVGTVEKQTRLLPIRIDDCEVPVALKSRRWLNFDPHSYDAEYSELLNAIFDRRERPALGNAPSYLSSQAPGYRADETSIWDAMVRGTAQDYPFLRDAAFLLNALPHLERRALTEAIAILEQDGLVKVERYNGGDFCVQLTAEGWHHRAPDVLGFNVEEDELRVLACLASDGDCDGDTLRQRTGIEPIRLIMAIDYLEASGLAEVLLVLGHVLGCYAHVRCTTAGRRAIRES